MTLIHHQAGCFLFQQRGRTLHSGHHVNISVLVAAFVAALISTKALTNIKVCQLVIALFTGCIRIRLAHSVL